MNNTDKEKIKNAAREKYRELGSYTPDQIKEEFETGVFEKDLEGAAKLAVVSMLAQDINFDEL